MTAAGSASSTALAGALLLGSGAPSLAQEQPDWTVEVLSHAAAPPAARTYTARVVRVADGDSLVVVGPAGEQRVRLSGIDAPEAGQPWSGRSRAVLTRLVDGRRVTVTVVARDRFDRDVAHVVLVRPDGPLEVNRELVRRGAAWSYNGRGQSDPATLDAEQAARAAGEGLWALPAARRLPPWQWRHARRQRLDQFPF